MTLPLADPGVLILDDVTPIPVNPTGFDGRGRDEKERPALSVSASFTGNRGLFPDEKRIPVKNMKDMITERRSKQIGGRFIRKSGKVGVRDQNGTNFCWGNGPVQALMLTRAAANLPFVDLSPASVCAPINGYGRNNGGMGINAMKYIAEHGVVPSSLWPANYYQSGKYATEDAKRIALDFVGIDWYTFSSRDIEAVWSSLLLNYFGAAGLNWWGHEVCYVDIAWDDATDRPIIDFDNSWGSSYGTDGQAYLKGSKAIPDDYQCWRVATAA